MRKEPRPLRRANLDTSELGSLEAEAIIGAGAAGAGGGGGGAGAGADGADPKHILVLQNIKILLVELGTQEANYTNLPLFNVDLIYRSTKRGTLVRKPLLYCL